MDSLNEGIEQQRLGVLTGIFMVPFCIWILLLLVLNRKLILKDIPKKKADDVRLRTVSIIHGLTSLTLCIYHLYYHKPALDSLNTPFQSLIFIVSASYFLYDTCALLYYGLADVTMLLHHSLVTLCFYVAVREQYGGPECVWALFLGEISNAPMNLRFNLRSLGLEFTKIYDLTEWSFFILYVAARGLIVPVLVYHTLTSSLCPIIVKLCCIGVFTQSIFFLFVMAKGLKKKLKNMKDISTAKTTLFWFSVNPQIKDLPCYNRKPQSKED